MERFGRIGLVGILAAVLLVLAHGISVVSAQIPTSQAKGAVYVVKAGDDLWTIGYRFGVSSQDIAQANDIKLSEPLQVGQSLYVPSPVTTHMVKTGESLWLIADENGVSVNSLIKVNGVSNPNKLKVGQLLYLPTGNTDNSTDNRTNVAAFRASSDAAFAWPIQGMITSYYGQRRTDFHTGIDIAADQGTPIAAARAGKVVFAGWSNGYGQAVKIDHGDGYETLYAHTSKILVQVGEQVSKGQIIAKVGSTGNSTGPHLHFEVRVNGTTANPLHYLPNSTVAANF